MSPIISAVRLGFTALFSAMKHCHQFPSNEQEALFGGSLHTWAQLGTDVLPNSF